MREPVEPHASDGPAVDSQGEEWPAWRIPQVRGTLRWKWRRAAAALRHGPARLNSLPVVFGNAMPKSGSKLLFNILRGLTEVAPFVDTGLNEIKPFLGGIATPQPWINRQLDGLRAGDVRFGYLAWTPETEARLCRDGWATVLILRDPRDAIVSAVFYATQMHRGHALHDYLLALPDMEARIQTMIRGIPEGPLRRASVTDHYRRYTPWLERREAWFVRYEELINDTVRALGGMLDYLRRRGFEPSGPDDRLVDHLRSRMAPGRSETFRRGKSGSWEEHFTELNRRTFRSVAGDLLDTLGYEA